jgi:hypothetical protein
MYDIAVGFKAYHYVPLLSGSDKLFHIPVEFSSADPCPCVRVDDPRADPSGEFYFFDQKIALGIYRRVDMAGHRVAFQTLLRQQRFNMFRVFSVHEVRVDMMPHPPYRTQLRVFKTTFFNDIESVIQVISLRDIGP